MQHWMLFLVQANAAPASSSSPASKDGLRIGEVVSASQDFSTILVTKTPKKQAGGKNKNGSGAQQEGQNRHFKKFGELVSEGNKFHSQFMQDSSCFNFPEWCPGVRRCVGCGENARYDFCDRVRGAPHERIDATSPTVCFFLAPVPIASDSYRPDYCASELQEWMRKQATRAQESDDGFLSSTSPLQGYLVSSGPGWWETLSRHLSSRSAGSTVRP